MSTANVLQVSQNLEAAIGIEPMDKGFADLCLTTWLRRLVNESNKSICHQAQARAYAPTTRFFRQDPRLACARAVFQNVRTALRQLDPCHKLPENLKEFQIMNEKFLLTCCAIALLFISFALFASVPLARTHVVFVTGDHEYS